MRLQGKVALVTGAGRGIGKAIALAFAREGADVVVVSRTLLEVEETANQMMALGRHVLAVHGDVSQLKDVENMVKLTLQEFGRIDILVNNAGILGPIGPLVENDVKGWMETIKVNLIGTFLCCKAIIPIMVERRKGKIINLSGGGAAYPRPRFSAYAASKAAVVRLTETLAEEVEEFNIQVNAIAPGVVRTKMLEQIVATGEESADRALANARNPLEADGVDLERVTSLAIFLASDNSSKLTGRLISAVWDDWRGLDAERAQEIMNKGFYTLRRIDGYFFIPKDSDMPRR